MVLLQCEIRNLLTQQEQIKSKSSYWLDVYDLVDMYNTNNMTQR